ncbi:MAG: Mu transposase C-terminal domain-containing protein [Treponema sp.]|jgi:putative transposase|nr:Mu transposase C-terminal domain-containing protein [Treponema sp.]
MAQKTGQQESLFSGSKKHLKKIEVYEDWIRRPVGIPILMAEAQLAQKFSLSASTVRRYIQDINVNGYHPPVRPKQGRKVYAWDSEAIDFMKGFYIAAQREVGYCTMRNAYHKTVEAAALKGWKTGSEQSAYTHLRDIHSLLLTYASGGARALDNIFYIARDLSLLAPFQVVVGDQHIFDFWSWYNGKLIRAQCYLWLDMRTRLVYGIDFEPGSYNHRTVARALRMGITRFGKFNTTYNDNGTAEKSGKIDHLVNALQTYGMSFRDYAELYRTREGEYAVEDPSGNVIATVESAKEWRRQNRRMYAQVKNAKAKPIERFFRTLEVLLLDMCLPGYVRDITLPAAEDEEAARRLEYQKEKGFILQYEEFIEKVKEAIVCYENRDHAGLNHSPLEELRLAAELEGWEPNRIDENDIRHIFLEQEKRVVKGNRIRIADINYVGPSLTKEMLKENRNNLAGLSGMKVEVYFDPDDLEAGAWAMDPHSGQSIYLTPENRINPFNAGELSAEIAAKRRNIKAVTGTYRDTVAFAGTVLTAPTYKPLIESQAAAEKAIADKNAKSAAMTEDDFTAAVAVASRLVQEQGERARRQAVYTTPMKRY